MTVLITGANGQLGRLVIDALLARDADPASIVAGARTPERAADLAERGIRVVELDYDRADTVSAAMAGIDDVLLISGLAEDRVSQHRTVIDAAASSGVRKLVYTSIAHAERSTLAPAPDHRDTESLIAASGLDSVLLRNNWYTEIFLPTAQQAAASGVVIGSAGTGRVASASRRDYADAAAVVLLEGGHQGQVYELSGDTSWDYADFARTISEIVGREVDYRNLSTEEHVAALVEAGTDPGMAGFIASIDTGIANGDLADADPTLARLIGRATTPLADTLRAALAG